MVLSEDGSNWAPYAGASTIGRASALADGLGSLWAAVDGRLLRCSKEGTCTLVAPFDASALTHLAHGNAIWVAVGERGTVTWSSNARKWSTPSSLTDLNFDSISFQAGKFIALASDQKTGCTSGSCSSEVWVSSDGKNWSKTVLGGLLHSIVWINQGWVATTDNEIWEGETIEKLRPVKTWPGKLTLVPFNQELFLLHRLDMYRGEVYHSLGLGDWIKVVTPTDLLYRLRLFDTQLVLDAYGKSYVSLDGERWEPKQVPFGQAAVTPWGYIHIQQERLSGYQSITLLDRDLKAVRSVQSWADVGEFILNGDQVVFVQSNGVSMWEPSLTCNRNSFTDLYSVLHEECIAAGELKRLGLVDGYPDGSFRPFEPITRAEFTKLLVTMLNLKPSVLGPLPFSDTPNHWVARMGYLQPAFARGIISGFPDGTFRPDLPITRAEMLQLVSTAARELPDVAGRFQPFGDVEKSEWYVSAIQTAYAKGLIGDQAYFPPHEFRLQPMTQATRGQAAVLLYNLWNRLQDEGLTP